MYLLQLEEIKLEQNLIQAGKIQNLIDFQGTHPQYLSQLEELESKKISQLATIKDTQKHLLEKEVAIFDSEVKLAHDTFLVSL